MAVAASVLAAAWAGAGAVPAQAESYLSIYSGSSNTNPSSLHILQPANGTDAVFDSVPWVGKPFTGSVYYGVRIGTYLRRQPHLGVEIDWNHYKAYAKTDRSTGVKGIWDGQPVDETAPISDRVQEFRMTNGVNTIALDLRYRWMVRPTPSFPEGRLQPYVAAGPALYILWPLNRIDGKNNSAKYRRSGWGWQALAGVQYGLVKRLNLFAEVKFTRGDARVHTADDGWGDTDLRTWHTVAGLQYTF